MSDEQGFFATRHTDEPPPPDPGAQRPGGRRHLASCLVVVVAVAVLAGGALVAVLVGIDRLKGLSDGPADYSGSGSGSVMFEVREGDSSAVIGRNLENKGVVASADAFTEAAAQDRGARDIQVGVYRLRQKMSAKAALAVLEDPGNLVQNSVTIPEGLRVEDIVPRLAHATGIPVRKFTAVLKRPAAIGLPSYAKGNAEGYLFPATYAFEPNADATAVLATMVQRWRQAADQADLVARAKAMGYTPGQLMTVASLVEAEANRDQDRGKVARVIYNRLETKATGRLLQIDATVNYALGRDLGLNLTRKDLAVDSPYNTRKYPGLPPGPIEAPGDAAIAAAAHPTPGDWLYYVTVNLDTGETKFATTYPQFLRYKQQLQQYCSGSERC